MAGKEILEHHLRFLDKYNQDNGIPSVEGLLVANGTWFEGRASSSDYEHAKAQKRGF